MFGMKKPANNKHLMSGQIAMVPIATAMPIIIALDAMGGDLAPNSAIEGASITASRHSNVQFKIFGQEAVIAPILKNYPALQGRFEICHAEEVVSNDEKPLNALRKLRNSSMRLALECVKDGNADAMVSGGNTGALMMIAKYVLGTMDSIDRPALASFFPTMKGASLMLDLGANVECESVQYVQFAMMGYILSRCFSPDSEPTIGLLNIGTEDLKGNDTLKEAAMLLKESPLKHHFKGFIEGDDISRGTVSVVVTDGFTGNVALKTAEGVAKMIAYYLKESMQVSWLSKLGYLLAKGSFEMLKNQLDIRHFNGGVFLGLNEVCVKSHGSMDGNGVATAIERAAFLVQSDFTAKVRERLEAFSHILLEPIADKPKLDTEFKDNFDEV